ncbi:hypothetical protein [Nostoc sp. DedQUE09]|uniref:hypothetical protein n=1 Tax=Nostoc sp. DedQUE09 TaxID=3075394 RepID=UPI002AD3019E|nr:hypothetical protein [Nostoc sp. DedQUE09]MDZ7953336.1 hypothetical protein [Nostoc sp. DedQUE09]MDZ7953364.1 hypothetical protein [Nostoc sp. DedQUE09]
MTSYCSLGDKTTVEILSPAKEILIFDNAPITVEVITSNEGEYQDYTHNMNQKIDKSFAKNVVSVIVNDPINDWIFSGEYPPDNPIVHRTCPIPSVIDGKIYLDFDPLGYSDNIGSCTYKVYFGGYKLTATDARGIKIQRTYDQEPKYTVACGDNCPEGSHKCTHKKYPGYCCVPCKEVGDRLKNIANKVGR